MEPFDTRTTNPAVFHKPLDGIRAVLESDEASRSNDTRLLVLFWVKVQHIKIPDEIINQICSVGLSMHQVVEHRKHVQERESRFLGNPKVMAKRKGVRETKYR